MYHKCDTLFPIHELDSSKILELNLKDELDTGQKTDTLMNACVRNDHFHILNAILQRHTLNKT